MPWASPSTTRSRGSDDLDERRETGDDPRSPRRAVQRHRVPARQARQGQGLREDEAEEQL